MLVGEKAVSEKCYLKFKQYKDRYQTMQVAKDLPPPVKGNVTCGRTDHEGAPPSGIEVVNSVEDLA